ncbi:flavin reductase like domain-containing protein [Xylariaceae sp. FL0662B]|nr:flavin reductase like domain-containing protein [Xylariaceae sp. FL0662B]
MKYLRGLLLALGPASPRIALHNATSRAQVSSSIRWRSSKASPPRDPKLLSQSMRTAMRQLPHPVVVITTLENNYSWQADLQADLQENFHHTPDLSHVAPRAITVSSFTSLCLDPRPKVTFNVTLPSRTYEAITTCQTFNVHILSGDDQGASIADLFTRGNHPTALEGIFAEVRKLGVEVLGQREWAEANAYESDNKEHGRGHEPEAMPLPLLKGPGIMRVLKCRLYEGLRPQFDHAHQTVINHVIVIGEVIDIIPGESDVEPQFALGYADGAYRREGKKIFTRQSRPT